MGIDGPVIDLQDHTPLEKNGPSPPKAVLDFSCIFYTNLNGLNHFQMIKKLFVALRSLLDANVSHPCCSFVHLIDT